MKNLLHIEDALFINGIFNEDISDILNLTNCDITLKWDGNPVVFVGLDKQNKMFVGLKSITSNVLCYTYDDILHYFEQEDLRMKLANLLADVYIDIEPVSGIYQVVVSELIASGNLVYNNDDTFSATPNYITYTIPNSFMTDSDVVIVPHTYMEGTNLRKLKVSDVYVGDSLSGVTNLPIKVKEIYKPKHDIHIDFKHIQLKPSWWNIYKSYVVSCYKNDHIINVSGLLGFAKVTKPFEMYICQNMQQWQNIIDTYKQIALYKNDLICYINARVETFTEDDNHEGYVIQYKNDKFKLVDRFTFSTKIYRDMNNGR